jgi:hypothetical protein
MENKGHSSLLTWFYLILGSAAIYFGLDAALPHPYLNIASIISGVFVLFQAFDNSDRHDHRGRYGNGK